MIHLDMKIRWLKSGICKRVIKRFKKKKQQQNNWGPFLRNPLFLQIVFFLSLTSLGRLLPSASLGSCELRTWGSPGCSQSTAPRWSSALEKEWKEVHFGFHPVSLLGRTGIFLEYLRAHTPGPAWRCLPAGCGPGSRCVLWSPWPTWKHTPHKIRAALEKIQEVFCHLPSPLPSL